MANASPMEIDFFILGVSFILLHELDAMRCHEWRMFPLTSWMGEKPGMIVFVLAHLPLFYWVLGAIQARNEAFAYWFSIFLVLHLVAHIGFLWHPKNEFKDWMSWGIIVGAGGCGVGYLV